MSSSISLSEDSVLEALNHTELYQVCRRVGLAVSPQASRAQMIQLLVGDVADEPAPEDHPINRWRDGIIFFLHEHWKVVEPQLKCPAKMLRHPTSPNPRPCYGCLDSQVVACVVENTAVLRHIKGSK